jgi:HPr kinase/phosphorylase
VTETLLMHATTVALDGAAILFRGPSGSGKSDLALRLIDGGAQLVADDQTVLQRVGSLLLAAAPPTIAGLIEIRGIGIINMEMAAPAPLLLIADLVAPGEVERVPPQGCETILGISVALIALAPFEASAVAKVRLLRRALAAGPLPAIIGS